MKSFRTFKKIVALSLAVTVLAGCTKEPSDNSKNSQGAEKTELVLGSIGALTGDYANYGISVKNGLELAINEINAAGGVGGLKFKLNFQDSQGNPESAVNAYGKLIDSKMDILLGPVMSGECASVVTEAANDDIFILSPSASAVDALKGNSKAYRVSFNDTAQGVLAADYIADSALAKKVAVFYASDSDYSVGLYDAFKEQAAKKNLEIVTTQTFTDSTKTDFSTQIAAIAATDAELVFIPIYAAEAAIFLEQASGKLKDKVLFGCDGLDGIIQKISDTAKLEGLMLLTPFAADEDNEKVKGFVEAYKAKYGTVPDQFAADGYDAVYVVADLLRHTNISSTDYSDLTARLVKAMTEISFKGTTGDITWTDNGEAVKKAKVMVIRDGVAVVHS